MILCIDGPLTFETIAFWQKKLVACLDAIDQDVLTLDFQGVTAVNSAALALILDARRRSRVRDVSLRFLNIPEQLVSLAKVSSLDKFLVLM